MIVRFVDIGGIVHYHCLNFIFIILIGLITDGENNSRDGSKDMNETTISFRT